MLKFALTIALAVVFVALVFASKDPQVSGRSYVLVSVLNGCYMSGSGS